MKFLPWHFRFPEKTGHDIIKDDEKLEIQYIQNYIYSINLLAKNNHPGSAK